WALERRGSEIFARCQLCAHNTDPAKTSLRNCKSHERSNGHQQNLVKLRLSDSAAGFLNTLDQHETCAPSSERDSETMNTENVYLLPDEYKHLMDKASIGLLASLNARFQTSSPPLPDDRAPASTSTDIPSLPPYWLEQHTFGLFEDTPEPHQFSESEAEAVTDLTQTLLGMFEHADSDHDSDSDTSEGSDNDVFNFWEDEEDEIIGNDEAFDHGDAEEPEGGRKRLRMSDDAPHDEKWYPWPDQILELFLWLLKVNGVNNIPSVYQMKSINSKLQQWIGVETLQRTSPFGNVYHVNNLSPIVAQ
ncbi:hypothetical protein MPER_07497, partial [Moniliophthora perniciosa FA553]